MTNLWAGPYVGEFGWELFHWQGWLRKESKKYKRVYVACRPGHEALYEDFASYIMPYPGINYNTDCEKEASFKYNNSHLIAGVAFDKVIRPWETPYFMPSLDEQEFVVPGKAKRKKGFDIILHARWTPKWDSAHRNWSKRKWEELVYLLKKDSLSIACMGSKNAALWIRGAVDLRGLPLSILSNHLVMSKLAVGPSSGPLHLATLNRCPQVTWGGAKKNYGRYTDWWNPFKVKAIWFSPNPEAKHNSVEAWDADIDQVYKHIYDLGVLK